MIKKVLIVDDDQEMLLALKEGMEKYDDTFSVLMAGDGRIAVEKLKQHTVSLVVTDLKMPIMDGFAVLSHVMQNYPGIPVIIITGYSTPEMERLAKKGGAVGYIEKPFMINKLAKRIMETLRKESDGGSLHNVSSGMFLQLMEMEQKTCTIRIVDKKTEKQGILFFKNGELLDARLDRLQGEDAAYRIFSWDEVNLSIQNECLQNEKKIHKDLQAILLEAMRLKDEIGEEEPPEPVKQVVEPAVPRPAPVAEDKPALNRAASSKTALNQASYAKIENMKKKLREAAGDRCGMEDVYHDDSWNNLIDNLKLVGDLFDAGEFRLSYIDKGDEEDFILVPGLETTVVTVNPKCPRDRLVQALTEN